MRHRIKAGKVGSYTPEKQKVELEQLEDREVAEEVEEIFERIRNSLTMTKPWQQWSSTIVLTQWNKTTDINDARRKMAATV